MIKVATWNMKQAVAPKKPREDLWKWAEDSIGADLMVLTEANVPETGIPPGWSAQWTPDGIGPRRRWGTVLAARGIELRPLTEVSVKRKTHALSAPWDAVLQIADVMIDGHRWATLVGMYGLTVDSSGASCGNGDHSVSAIIRTISPLLESDRGDRVIVAGDMNLWPKHASYKFDRLGLIDLIEWTGDERAPLERCANCNGNPGCGHMWTHKNGNSPNAAVQQIDFIFATEELGKELIHVKGGIADFPDSWEVSDHAPVVATFS